MANSAIPSVLCLLLLLLVQAPRPGNCSHTSYTKGGRHYILRSPSASTRPSSATPDTFCPSTASAEISSSDRLPVVYRLNPCSPLGAAGKLSAEEDDVFRRDAMRLRLLFGADGSKAAVPATGNPLGSLPGAFEYHVAAGYGTPVQNFTMGFDTATVGATLLQCKPRSAGEPCDHAFDPAKSSSLASVPCGSPDCPFSACSAPTCTFAVRDPRNGQVQANVTFVTDKLTLSPKTTVDNFRVACMEIGLTPDDQSSGVLDLSRNRHSLASRSPSSLLTVAFIYCLPSIKNRLGFLSIGAMRPELGGTKVSYANLRRNPARGDLYFVEIVAIGVGGPAFPVPIPPAELAGDTLMDLHTTFTYLKPAVYAAVRDEFRKWMVNFKKAAPVGELDTCYDFTGLKIYFVPVVALTLEGGAIMDLDFTQQMYFKDAGNPFSVGCLAFAAAPAYAPATTVIGTMAQATTEVVYDVGAEKVGFVPYSC